MRRLAIPASRRFASKAREQDVYTYKTPAFYKTRREDLADKWGELGFNIRPMNGHVRYTWSDGNWDDGAFVPAPYQLMHINAGALHYGVSVFEGLKAFACKDGKVRIMNPMLNAARMQEGADALLMPQVPKETFIAAVKEAVRRNIEFVPPYGHGASMYIRPLLFASGQMLGLAPLASEYTFFVTVMPAGGYFSKGAGEMGVKAVVSVEHDRAAPKGTGGVKAAGNYAADLQPVHAAHKTGFNTTLYLDAKERKYIEEFSVCNFVGITHDNKYVTPKSETILASTTNKMMQQLAKERGMIVENRPIDFEKEIGNFKEVGMCGTAAVVVKVQEIQHGDIKYEFDTFDTISSLRAELTGIQCGDVEDKFGWMVEVGDVFDETAPAFPALAIESAAPKMKDLEALGKIQKQGREALHGSERKLLKYVVKHAKPGDPNSVLSVMDDFWNSTFQSEAKDKWKVRGLFIANKVLEKVAAKTASKEPVRCLELGTYCGYSAIQIAKHLPEGSILLSVEQDELYAAIATKIIEFAGLESRVKIWMGTVHDEPANMSSILSNTAADFVLVDHSKERYVPDLKLLEDCGIVRDSTTVMGDLEVYPGDDVLPPVVEESIKEFFTDRAFNFANLV
jgi:branched-chain amino acid aminotransferase